MYKIFAAITLILSITAIYLFGISVSQADQVIYVDVAHYIPDDSQFGVEVKGNK